MPRFRDADKNRMKYEAVMKNITIIVPSYNPDEKLLEVVKGLAEGGFEDCHL